MGEFAITREFILAVVCGRSVLTGEDVAYTERYLPDVKNVFGHKGDIICFGSDDFYMYIESEGDYIYLLLRYDKLYQAGDCL